VTTALSYDRCLKALFSRQFESLTRLHRKFQRNAAKRIEESRSSDRFMESVVYTGLQQCRVRRVVKTFNFVEMEIVLILNMNCPHYMLSLHWPKP